MNVWNMIYDEFNFIVFSFGGIEVYWYGLVYVCVIVIVFYMVLRMI